MVSEHFVEAANATCINAAYGESEWPISGLTPVPCSTVKADRVGEAVFSIEGKLLSTQEFPSRAFPGQVGGTLAIIEGTRFWVREDALNEDKSLIDFSVRAFPRVFWGSQSMHILIKK
jgi:flavin reductase (DIM6/NTAB) family NADH-FMN oxidoreductase RutF